MDADEMQHGVDMHDAEVERRLEREDREHRDPQRERDLYLEDLAEQIGIVRNELFVLETRYTKARSWRPEHETARADRDLPGMDPCSFGRDDEPGTTREPEHQIAWPAA